MKFSIIFPTRERPELLKQVLDSIRTTAFNLTDVEVLIAIDEDDTTDYSGIYMGWVKVYRVKRSLNFSKDYYTYLANKSTGRWIICANDDCVFETPNWDVLAYDVLKDHPGVIYGWIEDGLGDWRAKGHGDYCCFPLQGRAGFEALGYIFPDRTPTWGADIWAKGLYDQVDSVIKLPFVMRHYCHHNFTREQDAISMRIMENQVRFNMKPIYEEINILLAALRKEYANK